MATTIETEPVAKCIRYALLKKKNKRIDITVWQETQTGRVSIQLEAIVLVGDWKQRNIRSSCVLLSLESFWAIAHVFDFIKTDSVFNEAINSQYSEIVKPENNFKCDTNIDLLLKKIRKAH